jgi:SAM-dependent methyltransferase
MLQLESAYRSRGGYLAGSPTPPPLDTTSADYAAEQQSYQPEKARRFLLPILRRVQASTVLDVGCGIGAMVETLVQLGFDAHGVDVAGTEALWSKLGRSRDRFIVVDPIEFRLPLADGAVDFAYSFGVIEHVGTTDGHADRRADYEQIRTAWLHEIIRTLRPGGYLLIGGPNRTFPIDAAHGPDSAAGSVARWLHRRTGLSIHPIWGRHFLWSFGDLKRYLGGLPCRVRPLSIDGLIEFGRVPRALAPLARLYVRQLPRPLLGTGFNPWMLALVERIK